VGSMIGLGIYTGAKMANRIISKRKTMSLSMVFALWCGLSWFLMEPQSVDAGQANGPDLVISNISNPPSSGSPGGSFSVTDTTQNSGNVAAAATTTVYYLSLDNTISSSDILLTGNRSIPSLNAGASSTASVTATMPSNLANGSYYLGACADSGSVVAETSETNNCKASKSKITISVPLSLSATPSVIFRGDTLTATWTSIPKPTSTDWIALYALGAANTNYVTWMYVNCTFSPTVAVPSGSCPFTVPATVAPGNYELRLLANNGYTTITTSNTIVVNAPNPPSISSLSPPSGPTGTVVTINGSNFGTTQGSSTVTFNGVSATPTNWTASAITTSVPVAASVGPVVVTVSGVPSNGSTFTVTYAPRVNAGGVDYTDVTGKVWSADREYGTGPWGYVGGTPASCGLCGIAGTTDDLLYQKTRYGTFSYQYDVPNGQYDVSLHFAETWSPNGPGGMRIFDVLIEGILVLDNYDPAADVGFSAAVTKTFRAVQVSDGQLKIDFVPTPGAADQNAIVSAISIEPTQSKLHITSINGGTNPVAGVTFPVVVQARGPTGIPINVTTATNVSLSVKSGAGTLGGTTSGTIAAGASQITIGGVTYSKADTGVVFTATATSQPPNPGDSAPFTVNAGNATTLAFNIQPGNATTSGAITGPPTVAVKDSQGNIVTSSTAQITVAIGNNPGGGSLTGTAIKNATAGVATFPDLNINQPGTGYTLTATVTGLTPATSNAFNVLAAGSVSGAVAKAAGGGAIAGASVQALQSGIVRGTASTNASGSYTLTGLVTGTYDIRASAGGFAPQTQNGVTVSAGATTANFSLSVAIPTAGIVYIYDELQRLKSVIDPVGEAATYAYDAVGNLLSITRNTSSQTSIIDFNPNSGALGSTVTIYGTGYSATPSQNSVTFNGVAATVLSSTLTQIVATVPSGAGTGLIGVTSPAGGATSATPFSVTEAAGAPTIATFTPAIGVVGTAVTVQGTNYDSTPANNEVHFNPTFAVVSTATSTSLGITVPASARSGPISVSTPNGTVTSTQDFFIAPPPYTGNDVTTTGRLSIGGSPLTVAIGTPNKVALAVFDGVAGQRISMEVTNSTFPFPGGFAQCATVKFYRPDGLEAFTFNILTEGNTFMDVRTLPINGTYTMVLIPWGSNIGQATFKLNNIPADNQGTIVAGGAPVNISTTVPGQRASLTFAGTANQVISLIFGNSTFPNPGGFASAGALTILNPDGSMLLNGGALFSPTTFVDRRTLPATGTYTLLFDFWDSNTGQATITLYDVPTDNQGTIVPSGPAVNISTTVPGQRAGLTFSGTANQTISLLLTNSTFPNPGGFASAAALTIFNPDGSKLVDNQAVFSPTNFVDRRTLPATGTYTILVDVWDSNTGQATINLYDVTSENQGTIIPGGSSVTITTTVPGQLARLTFNGTAGQRVSLQMSGVTIPSSTLTIYNPSLGPLVANQKYDIKMEHFDSTGGAQAKLLWSSPSTVEQIIPQSQLYLPGGSTGGGLQGDYFNNTTLSGAPALTRTDSTVDFTWSGSPGAGIPSDNFAVRWTGQVQAQFSEQYELCTLTDDGARLWINGLPVVDKWVGQGATKWCSSAGAGLASISVGASGAFVDALVLPVTGAYSILVDPAGTNTGNMTLTLYDVSADFTSTITANGPPVTANITVPGQNGKLTFNGTAGQTVSLTMNGVTIPNSTVTTSSPPLSPFLANQKYGIKMEYFEGTGGASAQLLWRSPSTVEQVITQSQLYLTGGSTAVGLQGDYFNNTTLTGAPTLARTDSAVDFIWSASPGAGINNDNFSVRWTGEVQAQFSEQYELCTLTDDGARLWINDLPIVDKWIGQGATKWCSGTPVALRLTSNMGTGGGSQNNMVLPVTGTYSIDINPSGGNVGVITFTLVNVP
jgi:YD repeat-containing protein